MAKKFPAAKAKPAAASRLLRAAAVAMALCLVPMVALVACSEPARPVSGPGAIIVIKIDGSINPAAADFLEGSINAAMRQHARALIIELDTPGGLLSTMRRMVKDLLSAPLPVIVYVAPSGASAASAGMFVTIAANIAAMAPGTTIGAAHPIEMGESNQKGVMGKKIENFAASLARSIAAQRGRNQAWVDRAVRQSASVDDREALRLHVVDIVARDLPALLAEANGRQVTVNGQTSVLNFVGAPLVRREMSLKERLIDTLSDPNIVYLLMMAGVLGIYFEFAHPGVYAPGIAGVICLLLALMAFQILPINNAGLLLLLLGIGLLTAEAFAPGYGVLGIGGLVSFILGSLFLIDTSQTNVVISRAAIAGVTIALALGMIGFAWVLSQRRRPATTGSEGLVGQIGEIRQAIRPGAAGWIFIHGEIWRATSDQPLDIGVRARVKAVKGMELEVQGVTQSMPPQSGQRGSL